MERDYKARGWFVDLPSHVLSPMHNYEAVVSAADLYSSSSHCCIVCRLVRRYFARVFADDAYEAVVSVADYHSSSSHGCIVCRE